MLRKNIMAQGKNESFQGCEPGQFGLRKYRKGPTLCDFQASCHTPHLLLGIGFAFQGFHETFVFLVLR